MFKLIFVLYCTATIQGLSVRTDLKKIQQEVSVNSLHLEKNRGNLVSDNNNAQVCALEDTKESDLVTTRNTNSIKEEPNSINDYYKDRSNEITTLKKGPIENHPYPSHYKISKSLDRIYEDSVKSNELHFINISQSLAGRVLSIITNTPNETIYELKSERGSIIQVILNETIAKNVKDVKRIKRGDVIGVKGYVGENKSEKLSMYGYSIELLSPCLHQIPEIVQVTRKTPLRYLDFMLNDKSRKVFRTRAKIISYIRHFLDNNGFLEVETPILNQNPGGATAVPFKTNFNGDLLFLRIAPELHLKMLIVGGFNKIYEIGKQFRNEEVDTTHNPEFTSCELYVTYADYNDLMVLSETLLSELVKHLYGSYKIIYRPNDFKSEGVEIDFKPPYARVQAIPTLQRLLNVTFPSAEKLNSPEANEFLYDLCIRHHVSIPTPKTTARLFDSLLGKLILDNIVNPTFITKYPEILSPLAKSLTSSPGLTERFEFFIMGKEFINAYTELNDPEVQRRRFLQQSEDREAGDEEIPPTNEEFITALEYGLPPTAGWGLGIDRLVMLLTNSSTIKDVLLFPADY